MRGTVLPRRGAECALESPRGVGGVREPAIERELCDRDAWTGAAATAARGSARRAGAAHAVRTWCRGRRTSGARSAPKCRTAPQARRETRLRNIPPQLDIDQGEKVGSGQSVRAAAGQPQQRSEAGDDIRLAALRACANRRAHQRRDRARDRSRERDRCRTPSLGVGNGVQQRRRRNRRDQDLGALSRPVEAVLERATRVVEHAISRFDRPFPARLGSSGCGRASGNRT